ncbi:hypothetical protein D5R93_10385 [Actinomyces lilanjuaniae]|uniref:Uncharacterized protein n=1 Tax=Actinomyces lilanjuaniae TaxID=2321394 RepID=A0ABM6Z552_9ACTO|nr:hypothetical protein D5R93_10385 [Actinomyces lilanjuaniae]
MRRSGGEADLDGGVWSQEGLDALGEVGLGAGVLVTTTRRVTGLPRADGCGCLVDVLGYSV